MDANRMQCTLHLKHVGENKNRVDGSGLPEDENAQYSETGSRKQKTRILQDPILHLGMYDWRITYCKE